MFIVLALVGMIPLGVSAQDTLEELRFGVERYEIIGDNPLREAADRILAPFVGEQYGLEGLSAARDALEQALIGAGYNFHRVSLPPQELLDGTVILQISRFAIGQVLVEGNEFFDDDNIRGSVPGLRVARPPTPSGCRARSRLPTSTPPRVPCYFSARARAPTVLTPCSRSRIAIRRCISSASTIPAPRTARNGV